jgi:hypothetical protein
LNKAELIETAGAMGILLAGNETKAEIEAIIEAANSPTSETAEPPETVARSRINRGSTRRIARALEGFEKAMDEFTKEIDFLVFSAEINANGEAKRVGTWSMVERLRAMKAEVREQINNVL